MGRLAIWIGRRLGAVSISGLLRGTMGENGFVLLASVATGVIAGFAAVVLKSLCGACHSLVGSYNEGWPLWVIPALPGVGILLCVMFAKVIAKGKYEKGLTGVIASTSHGTGELPRQKMYSHILTSAMSVGLGGSAGLEAPIALTGSAIGANTASGLGLGREGRILLLACGGAGGIAAIFDSPVAGTLFACEVLLPEFSVPALIPLLMSAAAATVVSSMLHSKHTFMALSEGWSFEALPFYVALGVLCGLISTYMIRMNTKVGTFFQGVKSIWWKAAIGGVALYAAFLLMPSLKGEGYACVNSIVGGDMHSLLSGSPLTRGLPTEGWWLICLVGCLILSKAAVSAITIDSGGDGGIFAPSMFTGAFSGLLLSRAVNLSGALSLSEVNFIAAGMGGVLSGVMHAPMTGIFLIAEMTGGYKLFVPLMIVSALSFFVCKRFEPYNVYQKELALKGESPCEGDDTIALEGMSLSGLVEKDFSPVKQGDTLRALLKCVMGSNRNVFPVLDEEGGLSGIVSLAQVRPFILDSQLYDVALVYDVMSPPGPALDVGDSLGAATRLFEKCGAWNLPVLEKGKYVGFVSKSGVFDKYREALRTRSELF